MFNKKFQTSTGWLSITIPEKLHEVTLGQLMQIQTVDNLSDLDTIAILSNTTIHDLQNIANINDLQFFNKHILSIAHQLKHLYKSDAIPQKVSFTIDGKHISVGVIKDLSVEPAGAFMAAREIIAGEIDKHITQYGEEGWQEHYSPSLQNCTQILAQYFYCRATGKPYNEYAAAEFEEHIKQLPVTDALPIAKYFFLNYPNLSRPRTGFWHRLRRRWSSAPA